MAHMKLNLIIDSMIKESSVTVYAPEMSDNVKKIVQCVDDLEKISTISGHKEQELYFLDIQNVLSFVAQNKQIYAITQYGQFIIKERLYQLEQILPSDYIRVSKSEIINKHCIEKLSLETNGSIKLYLKHNYCTYSSRRYLKSIKERLEI
jgi:DNA-binding LytR/AlgR family response regulator